MINGVSQYTGGTNGIDLSAVKARREEMFAQMDTSGDGYVDKAEFTAFGQQLADKAGTAPNADDLFAKIDTDGDGKISKTEDEAFRATMKKHRKDMFAEMDTNGDGTVDKTEFAAFTPPPPPDGATTGTVNADDMFAKIDSDGDGKITKDEMTAFMEKMKDKDSSTPATQTQTVSSMIGDSLQYLLDSLSKNSATAQSASAIQQYLTTAQTNTLDSLNMVG